jgi:hypothetical protein
MFGNLFKKNKGKENVEVKSEGKKTEDKTNEKSYDDQIDWLLDNDWLVGDEYSKNSKNILVMDDKDDIISAVLDDLGSLDKTNDFFLYEYNIITTTTKMAGFDVLDILENAPDVKIDFALLDIILGGKKIVDGKRKMVDGVDVAIEIWEHFPNADILFFSGCIIEPSDDPTSFKNKFDDYTDDDLSNYMLPKDIAFNEELKRLTYFFNGYNV